MAIFRICLMVMVHFLFNLKFFKNLKVSKLFQWAWGLYLHEPGSLKLLSQSCLQLDWFGPFESSLNGLSHLIICSISKGLNKRPGINSPALTWAVPSNTLVTATAPVPPVPGVPGVPPIAPTGAGPYTATCSFDTAGRTMMGVMPDALVRAFDGLEVAPLAFGANCGVGASDILVTVLSMCSGEHSAVISKGNCGIPQFQGTESVYSGTPELMASYAQMAADAGARIVGGCCGTSPEHLASMRRALDARVPAPAPTIEEIVERIGPLTNSAPTANAEGDRGRR
eukprot:gene18933-38071_t